MTVSFATVPATGMGILGQVVADATKVKGTLDTLTERASSGLVATSYAGLGGGAGVSLNLQPRIAALQTWQKNIDSAATRMQVTQTALDQLQSIASDFNSKLMSLNGLSASDVDAIAADARDALTQVTNLLDTRDGDAYVFGGQDTSYPPVPDPNAILTSGFYTQINAAVGGLAANGAAATAASTLAIASSDAPGDTPFSAYMSQPVANLQAPVVQTGDGIMQPIGLFASGNSWVPSLGGATTGSYTRDLLRSLATIASLSSTQVNDAGFADLIQDTRVCMTGAITALSGDQGVLGDTQARLSRIQTQLSETETALTGQVSNVQDADMAETLSSLSQVQTQLQASYQLIASMSNLSLVKYLSVG